MFRRGLVVVRGWGERGFKFTRARLNHGKVFKTTTKTYLMRLFSDKRIRHHRKIFKTKNYMSPR